MISNQRVLRILKTNVVLTQMGVENDVTCFDQTEQIY